MSNPAWAELISCWFAETLDDPATITGRMGRWFSSDEKNQNLQPFKPGPDNRATFTSDKISEFSGMLFELSYAQDHNYA